MRNGTSFGSGAIATMEKSTAPSFSSHRSPLQPSRPRYLFPMSLSSYSTLQKHNQKGRKEIKISKHSSQAAN
jgi:hypothetical protein